MKTRSQSQATSSVKTERDSGVSNRVMPSETSKSKVAGRGSAGTERSSQDSSYGNRAMQISISQFPESPEIQVVPKRPTTPPGSPRVSHVHPKRTTVPSVGSKSAADDFQITFSKGDSLFEAPENNEDEIVLYGQAKTSWRSAASAAHFVGDGCMLLARRGRLSAISAVGLYFVAVNLCVIVTIHMALSTVSVASSTVLYMLGSSVFVRLTAAAVVLGGLLKAPAPEGSTLHMYRQLTQQALLHSSLVLLTALQDLLGRAAPPSPALHRPPGAGRLP